MATATIPVDLRNPGQVFACLGFMEAAEVLIGPAEGGFAWEGSETQVAFTLSAEGPDDPVRTALAFLARAEVKALAPKDSSLSTAKWGVETIVASPLGADGDLAVLGNEFPCPLPDSPAALPIVLTDGSKALPIDHWADDFASSGRDNVKFWAGAAGYPGAALARVPMLTRAMPLCEERTVLSSRTHPATRRMVLGGGRHGVTIRRISAALQNYAFENVRDALARVDGGFEGFEDVLPSNDDHRVDPVLEE